MIVRRALFVPDNTSGMGHVVRCRALAAELTERGWECSTVSPREPKDVGVDVVVMDGPDYPPEWYSWPGAKVVGIFDAAAVDPFQTWARKAHPPDLVVYPGAKYQNMRLQPNPTVLSGPDYSLIRREFREVQPWHGTLRGTFDLRTIENMPACEMAEGIRKAASVVTYGGMRAMEAACVLQTIKSPAVFEIHARNHGEELNKAGLERGARVDGLGCKRVADVIEEIVK